MRVRIACVLLLVAASALAEQPVWVADADTGCRVQVQEPSLSGMQVSWSGACANGMAQGRGTLRWRMKDGRFKDRYEGEMRDGQRHGQGKYTWPSGAEYVGEFRDNEITGRGVLESAGGSRYEGEFINSRADGHGTYTQVNGNRYTGDWRGGRPHGFGKYVFQDGDAYEGSWSNGCFRQGDRRAWLFASEAACRD